MNDPVKKPKHYQGDIEPLDFIFAQNLGWCEANVVKYVTRWKRKNGVQDLMKAKFYLEYLIGKQNMETKLYTEESYLGEEFLNALHKRDSHTLGKNLKIFFRDDPQLVNKFLMGLTGFSMDQLVVKSQILNVEKMKKELTA
tara:strand:- start:3 stop:425 length:423 start_codon:yes stop_codon:yes gene_type:complete